MAISWLETFDEVLAKVHQGPVKLDPVSGGRCVLKDATLLGLTLRVTFRFDRNGRMSNALLERAVAESDSDSQVPESMNDQLRRHRQAIAQRRAALEQILGQGSEDPSPRPHPLPSVRWTSGELAVEHRISWNVERGGDEYGYLDDRIEISRVA